MFRPLHVTERCVANTYEYVRFDLGTFLRLSWIGFGLGPHSFLATFTSVFVPYSMTTPQPGSLFCPDATARSSTRTPRAGTRRTTRCALWSPSRSWRPRRRTPAATLGTKTVSLVLFAFLSYDSGWLVHRLCCPFDLTFFLRFKLLLLS